MALAAAAVVVILALPGSKLTGSKVQPSPSEYPEASAGFTMQQAWDIADWTVKNRRSLHAQPELLYDLSSTSAYIRSVLDSLNIPYVHPVARVGIVATIGTGASPCVGLRADMDALPIHEEDGSCPYRSKSDGRMHACGHDAHVAMLLSAARMLKAREAELKGTVKLIFQPAEEGGAGGLAMIQDGLLDVEPKIERAFALHVWPGAPAGEVLTRVGTLMAAAGFFHATMTGHGGHAAMPHTTTDPFMCVTAALSGLQTIVSRNVHPVEAGVVSNTFVNGGAAYNVIPDTVAMGGTIRSLTKEGYRFLDERVAEVLKGAAQMGGCKLNLTVSSFDEDCLYNPAPAGAPGACTFPPTVVAKSAFAIAKDAAVALVGKERFRGRAEPTMGGEDFAYILEKVPGAMLFLGIGNATLGTDVNLHNPKFRMDEDQMHLGAALHVEMALRSLAKPVGAERPCADVTDDASLEKLPASMRAQCEQGTEMGDVDTTIGALQYPDEIDIGFVHHAFYAVLLCYLLHNRQTILFAICGVEELPTLIVGASHLFGGAANPRFSVGVVFFLTRVTYHVWITIRAIDSLNPLLYWVSSVVLVQHVSWFQAFVAKGTLPSKRQQRSSDRAADEKAADEKAVDEKALWAVASRHLVAFMLIVLGQALLHGALTIAVLRAAFDPGRHDGAFLEFTPREWVEKGAWAAYILSGHVFVLVYTVRRLVHTLRDVYAASFIDGAIDARRIIYNISWEDPAVERELLGLGGQDVILTIASAGCNVLDYLIEKPKAIVACDLNVAQLAVLDLKLAAIQTLDHAPFFALWAKSDVTVFDEHYERTLRPALALESSRAFWDANGHELFRHNFFFAGTSGFAAWLMRCGMRACGVLGLIGDSMRRHAPPNVRSVGMRALAAALSQMWLWRWLAPLGGVPLSQIDLLRREPSVWIERVLEVLHTRMWRPGNYFYYAYVVGEWTEACCPRYLQPEHFKVLRAHAGRVTLHHGPLAAAATLRDDFTVASLLDSMDWMSDAQVAEQLAALLPRMAKRGRLFWRSFGNAIHSPVLAQLRPAPVDEYDRVGWYLSSWVAEVPSSVARKGDPVGFGRFLCRGTDYAPVNSPWDDVYICACMAHHALRTDKDVVAFYRAQGTRYDGFREALLPGRERLLCHGLPWHEVPKTWLSVGCGTARDLEYVLGHVEACETTVWLLDLSAELLAMAQLRVERLGIAHRVHILVGDICDASVRAELLPPPGSFDLVTCSYCLTMIPDWRGALEAMVAYVRPKGGQLALVDFTCRSDAPRHWSQRLNRWWFAHDGVFLNAEHMAALRSMPGMQTIWMHESEKRVVYTPLQATSYLFVGRKV